MAKALHVSRSVVKVNSKGWKFNWKILWRLKGILVLKYLIACETSEFSDGLRGDCDIKYLRFLQVYFEVWQFFIGMSSDNMTGN